MIYEQEHSIFDKNSLYKKFYTLDTKFEVTDGKISHIISDSEIDQYSDSTSSVFSRLNSRMETVEGYEQQISSLKTTVDDDGKTINDMVSKISTLSQTDEEIKASVSQATKTLTDDVTSLGGQLDGVKERVETAELAIKPDAIYSTVKKAESWTSDRQGDIDAAVGEAQKWTKSSESGIMQTADAIDMFVQESDVDGNYVISKINLDSTSAKIQARNINLQGAVSISDFDTSTQKLVNSHDMRFFTTAYQWDQAGIDNVANIGHVTTWTVKESIDDVMVGNTVIIQLYNKTKKIDSYLMAEVKEIVSVGNKQIKCSCIGLLERGLDGLKGDTGVGIETITNYYLASKDGTGVTTSTTGWTTAVQTMTVEKKFLWNYEITRYTDGKSASSDPHVIGVFGNDGKGIKKVEEYYALSNTINVPQASSFTTSTKTVSASNKYLWNYEKITYSDDTVEETDKRIIGTYGDKGDKGDPGVSISSVTNYYLASSSASGVTRSTSGWKTDPSTQTLTETKKYLWNYEDNLMTDNSHKYVEPHIISMFAKDGVVGKDGVSITEVKEFFARSTGTSASTIVETFTNTALQLTSTYKYLWNYEVVYFSDGTSTSNESKKRIIGVYGDTGAKGADGKDGAEGMSVQSSTTEYYLSTNVEEPDQSWKWQTTPPAWKSGYVYWERVHTILSGPNGSKNIYSTPVLSQGLNSACKDANSAATTLARWAHKNNTTLMDGSNIYTGTIGAEQIASRSITADKIVSNAIQARHIRTDTLVGKELYVTDTSNRSWQPTIRYRNSPSSTADDRISFRDNNTWYTSMPSYQSSSPYLWAYQTIGTYKSLPVCIGKRNGSTTTWYHNINVSEGRVWSNVNNNILLFDDFSRYDSKPNRLAIKGGEGEVSIGYYEELGSGSWSDTTSSVDIRGQQYVGIYGRMKGVGIFCTYGEIAIDSGQGKVLINNVQVTGSKSRLVKDTLYGDRLQYSYETPTPMFGDVGLGQLDENGEATIAIDDIFNETVNTSIEYAVFLQKEGPGDVWVDEKTELYFTVKGTPGLKFAWELKAVQKGYENRRLDDDTILYDQEPMDDPIFEDNFADELKDSLEEVDNLSSDLDKEMEELLNA